jgi:TonB-linked SusC/RagA family outer membrane protein
LDLDTEKLDEVVVIGYGTQKKSHLTGSVAKLSSDGLSEVPVSRADQVLQGRMAGMSIKNISGDVGSSPEIRVRGMGSISADNSPLIVVDGYPIPDDLSSIDMADVQSIEVLKDAASTAIYGSRGSNGVILITTKSGSDVKTSYNFSAYSGFKTALKIHDIISSIDYYDNELKMRQYNENYSASLEDREADTENYTGRENTVRYIVDQNGETDWQDEALRTGKMQNYSLSVSGGSTASRYYISGSYLNDQGLFKDNDYDKFNLRAKTDAKLSKRVNVGINLNPSYSKQRKSTVGLHDFARTYSWLPIYHNAFTSELTGEPIGSYAHARHFAATEVRDEDGNIVYGSDGEPTTVNIWSSGNNNPVSVRDNTFSYNTRYRLYGNGYLDINIIEGLNFKSTFGGYVSSNIYEYFINSEGDDTEIPEGYYKNTISTDLLSENYFTYNKVLNSAHSINVLGGYSAQKHEDFNARLEGSNQPTDYIETLNAATEFSQSTDDTYTYKEQTTLLSYLGRISYAYFDKYLITLSTRWDGSSLFGPENRWAWFPSASVGWRVSEERFMENVTFIDQLKLRASYGLSGNNDIENYAHTNTLFSSNYIFGTGQGTINPGLGYSSSTMANPSITWERTYESDFGLDLSIYNDRLTLGLDYYYSITDQLLLENSIPAHSGFTNEWDNRGKVRNRGFEIEVKGYPIKSTNNFSWSVAGNLSTNDNMLIDFGGASQLISEAYQGHKYIAKVGEEAIQFFGYKTDGVWLSQDEIDNNPSNSDAVPGGLKYVDTNGDDVINDDDRVALGSPYEDFSWGLTNTFKYKNFDLSFLLQGVVGNEIFNANGYYYELLRLDKAYNASNQYVNEMYPGDGKTPSVSSKANFVFTDYLIEDGSYTALRSLTLGYNLPKEQAARLKLNGLRVYASGQNLLYIMSDDYRGINPESVDDGDDYDSPLKTGAQRGPQPIARTIVFGIDIKF